MARFTIKNGQLKYGRKILGPKNALFKDFGEPYDVNGSVVLAMPERMDLAFVSMDRVVGIEVKKVEDLINSWYSRRLQRQLRFIRHSCDIGCLMIRCNDGRNLWPCSFEPDLQDDLFKFQLEGGYVLFGPEEDKHMAKRLESVKRIFDGEKNTRTIFSGEETRRVKGTEKEQAVQRLFRGVGIVRAKSLVKGVGGLIKILQCDDVEFLEHGGTKKALTQRKRIR